jgi:hypothetical protein
MGGGSREAEGKAKVSTAAQLRGGTSSGVVPLRIRLIVRGIRRVEHLWGRESQSRIHSLSWSDTTVQYSITLTVLVRHTVLYSITFAVLVRHYGTVFNHPHCPGPTHGTVFNLLRCPGPTLRYSIPSPLLYCISVRKGRSDRRIR